MSLTLFAEYKNTLSVNADIFNHGIDVQSDLATYPDPQIGGGDLKLIDINEYERSRCSAFIYNDGGLPYELTKDAIRRRGNCVHIDEYQQECDGGCDSRLAGTACSEFYNRYQDSMKPIAIRRCTTYRVVAAAHYTIIRYIGESAANTLRSLELFDYDDSENKSRWLRLRSVSAYTLDTVNETVSDILINSLGANEFMSMHDIVDYDILDDDADIQSLCESYSIAAERAILSTRRIEYPTPVFFYTAMITTAFYDDPIAYRVICDSICILLNTYSKNTPISIYNDLYELTKLFIY